ncbi:MAG TPA: SDR family NAD(P)-dependent oxidoreductase [Actinocrinis sp.]|jgi:NAD(P)-dependent dehydrogenase (short-subunit alcohol dehydrogenase family)|nr:SDR family NAD(P)-dependent oxidoreductase [Actinocrinis sp.]
MPERGTLLIAGASGTVGTALLRQLLPLWAGPVIAVGRRPPALRVTEFLCTDLGHQSDLGAACERIRASSAKPISAVVLAAGIDNRSTIMTFEPGDMENCFRINATSQLYLLASAVDARTPIRVVAISSDVVGKPTPGTMIYGASKAALEEGIRHATVDHPHGSLTALLVRLPYIGVPMGQPTPTIADSEPLAGAATSIVEFLTVATVSQQIRTWPDA